MKLFKRKLNKKQKAALNALADGIECGAKLRPQQATGGLFKSVDYDKKTMQYIYGTCALGAAAECALVKLGVTDEIVRKHKIQGMGDYDEILALYGLEDRRADRIIKVEETSIVDEDEGQAISTLIYRLNDQQGWERERIAAFLRECE